MITILYNMVQKAIKSFFWVEFFVLFYSGKGIIL